MNENSITVGEFKEHLEQLDDDDILHLPGGLGFNKIRRAGDNAYMIEQVEMQMFPEEEFLKKNPYFKVAFTFVRTRKQRAPVLKALYARDSRTYIFNNVCR